MNGNKIYSLVYNKEKRENLSTGASDYQILKNRSLRNSGASQYSTTHESMSKGTAESMAKNRRDSYDIPIIRNYRGVNKVSKSRHREGMQNMFKKDNADKYVEDKSI